MTQESPARDHPVIGLGEALPDGTTRWRIQFQDAVTGVTMPTGDERAVLVTTKPEGNPS